MADKKISQLTVAGSLVGTELLAIVQGGTTVQTTLNNITSLVNLTGYVPFTGASTNLDLNGKVLKNFFISKTADATAKFVFDVSALSTATTRTLTVRDLTGTIALTSDKLSAFAATTSAELAGVISDETGSGALVFGTSPTFTTDLTTPQINGVASLLTLNSRTKILEGSSDILIGERSAGNACIWFGQSASPTATNYVLGGSSTGVTILNGSGTLGTINIRSLNANTLVITGAATSGTNHTYDFTQLSKTGQTAADSNTIRITPGTTQFTTGSPIAVQRTNYFRAAVYTATSAAQTVTDLVNGYFEANTASTNLIATNNWALWSNGNFKCTADITTLTINKVTLTAPATGSTLTIADGKTLTVNNSITFTGTDLTTMTLPSTSSTLAAIGDNYFSITFNAGTQGSTMHNPADATTYYIGNTLFLPNGSATHGVITIPVNATLVGYNINIVCAGVVGSGESASFYARVNNTTDITLSTAITYNSGTAYQQFESMALNTNVTANDKINIKVVYPTFATNPTSVFTGVTLWFKRR